MTAVYLVFKICLNIIFQSMHMYSVIYYKKDVCATADAVFTQWNKE